MRPDESSVDEQLHFSYTGALCITLMITGIVFYACGAIMNDLRGVDFMGIGVLLIGFGALPIALTGADVVVKSSPIEAQQELHLARQDAWTDEQVDEAVDEWLDKIKAA